jgi:hypothetical protein
MSNFEEKLAPVHVRSVGGPVRISLLDHRFLPVKEPPAVGDFTANVKPGLYLLRCETGWFSQETPIKVGAEGFKELELRVPFPSAAPVPGTTGYRSDQAEAARRLSLPPWPDPNSANARLMLFLRAANPDPNRPPSLDALARLDADFRPLRFTAPVADSSAEQGWAGWSADVLPGFCVLRWLGDGLDAPAVDQALWTASGWTTIVFLTVRPADLKGQSAPAPNRQDPSIHLVKRGEGFRPDPAAADNQLAMELALAGWRTGKPLVDEGSLLTRLLDEKFANPMLGIVAAHVLLQGQSPDLKVLDEVLGALETRLIPSCPDVRALRAVVRRRFNLAGSVPLLDWPPMFKASFQGAIASDWGGRGVISPGSLAERVAPRLVPLSPWTTWLSLPTASDVEAHTAPAPLRPESANPQAEAEFLGGWLRRVLPELPMAETVVKVFGLDWRSIPEPELWRRFAESTDATLQKLAAQLREMYHFAQRGGALDRLDKIDLAGVAKSLNLPQASVASSAMRLAGQMLSQRDPEAEGSPMAWPPAHGPRFIRGDAFGRLLLQVVEQLVRKYPGRDFTDGAAQVFAWFDAKLKQNRRFINGQRFPTESAFRAYLRQAVWNTSRQAERSRRKGGAVQALPSDQKLASSAPGPQQLAALRESVAALAEPFKRVLELLFFEGKELDWIADSLHKTRRQIAQLYDEAIDRLSAL